MTAKRRRTKDAVQWSYSAGEWGTNRVRVYDRGDRGIFFDYFDETGSRVRSSLGHSDRDRAKAQADQLAATFREHERRPARLTLAKLFDIYDREVTPQKGPLQQGHDKRTSEMLLRFYGPDREPRTLSRRDWDRFIDARRRGTVRPKGVKNARGVGNRIIEKDLKYLLAVLNWAVVAGDDDGAPLLERNPLRGMPLPTQKNPKRPALTAHQFRALLGVANHVHSHMLAMLVIAYETGHRIASIRHLRWSDVDTQGKVVTWRAEYDKEELAHTTPLTDGAVEAFVIQRRALAIIGDGWVFPMGKDAKQPASRHTVIKWWDRAAKLAKLPTGERFGWHSVRRGWASSMRDVNPRDLCDLGGWKSYDTPLKCYIRPSMDAQRAALAQRRELVSSTAG